MSIELEHVNFSYGEKMVLEDVNLHVDTGEFVGIVGGSGGGKSTLLKLLSGLYEPDNGVIRVSGMTKPQEIRGQVAMVMQSPMLFPTSIRENITCGHRMEERNIMKACEAAKLLEWIDTLPDGLDSYVGERESKVSGGQAQRIAIARAIAKDAKVILLDEATSALDSDTRSAVLEALIQLTKGKTVVHVTHQQETLKDCHRILRLEAGKLVC